MWLAFRSTVLYTVEGCEPPAGRGLPVSRQRFQVHLGSIPSGPQAKMTNGHPAPPNHGTPEARGTGTSAAELGATGLTCRTQA